MGVLRILRKHGFTCLEASDAFKCMELLDKEHIDLILCDIKMPGMNGLTLVKAMAHRIPDTAVVMVSSMDNTEMAMECLRYGAYGYVLKPFKTTDILIAVANALRRRMLELDYRDREAVLAQPGAGADPGDPRLPGGDLVPADLGFGTPGQRDRRPRPPDRPLCRPDGPPPGLGPGAHGMPPGRRSHARHRQDRCPRSDPPEGRTPHGGGVDHHEDPPHHGRQHPEGIHRPLHPDGCPGGRLPP